jgi:hypothetical protein
MTRPFRSERCPCGRRWERGELEFGGPARAACPGRGSAGRRHSLKRPWPALRHLCAIMAALAATPATAAHCPFGQIWRLRLDRCVAVDSALARPYVHQARFRPLAIRRVAADDAPPPAEPAPYPPPPPATSQVTLDRPLVLPELEDGAPAIWRLCQAEPKLCKASER